MSKVRAIRLDKETDDKITNVYGGFKEFVKEKIKNDRKLRSAGENVNQAGHGNIARPLNEKLVKARKRNKSK